MILSLDEIFSNDQAITVDAVSTNVIDLGTPDTPFGAVKALNQDVGKGTPIPILIQVTSAFATLTSLTITVEVSANSDLSSSTVLATETILAAALVAGKKTFLQVLPEGVNARYLGIRYNVNGSDATAGTITAGITAGNQSNIIV